LGVVAIVLFWFVKDGKDEMINLMLIDNDK